MVVNLKIIECLLLRFSERLYQNTNRRVGRFLNPLF